MIFAYGAESESDLNVANEHRYKNIVSSNSIVKWYNAHPEFINFDLDLEDKKNVVIIGNGNVKQLNIIN